MAALADSLTTLNNVGNKEDVEDVIYRVSPEETPFMSNIGKVKVRNTLHQWQTESLATPVATNAVVEGDDSPANDAPNLTSMVRNYCQIGRKVGGVSRTQEIVDAYGRQSDLARQKVIRGIELRRDFEMRMVGNYASNAESGATPRRLGGALAWVATNDNNGAGGSSGGYNSGTGVVDAASTGTNRSFTEALVKATMATAFEAGANRISQAYMSAALKQTWSTFTGIADIRANVSGKAQATIYGAADVYVSDFGSLTLIPHAYSTGANGLAEAVLLIDPDMWAVGTLDGFKTVELARTGDAERFLMTAELTLVCRNEKASAAIRDLNA